VHCLLMLLLVYIDVVLDVEFIMYVHYVYFEPAILSLLAFRLLLLLF
jgi:hypothetical protein